MDPQLVVLVIEELRIANLIAYQASLPPVPDNVQRVHQLRRKIDAALGVSSKAAR